MMLPVGNPIRRTSSSSSSSGSSFRCRRSSTSRCGCGSSKSSTAHARFGIGVGDLRPVGHERIPQSSTSSRWSRPSASPRDRLPVRRIGVVALLFVYPVPATPGRSLEALEKTFPAGRSSRHALSRSSVMTTGGAGTADAQTDRANFCARVELFSALDPAQVEAIAAGATVRQFSAGAWHRRHVHGTAHRDLRGAQPAKSISGTTRSGDEGR